MSLNGRPCFPRTVEASLPGDDHHLWELELHPVSGNLEKLKDLEVDYYCADHYGYVTGGEAGEFVSKTIEMAKDHRAAIENAYRSTGDIDMVRRQ